MKELFTSESVTIWHPDKICDQISDSILDECLLQDPNSRVAVECLITTNKLVISWEITTKAVVDYEKIARDVICDIGYDSDDKYFNGHTCDIEVLIHTQSPDIAQGVDIWGAWDQWIMFGYATNETPALLPMPIYFANLLTKRLREFRENWADYILPDWKSQVTVEYENWMPKRIDTIVVSTQHIASLSHEKLEEIIRKEIIIPILWEYIDWDTKIFVNPTWRFVIWWPAWDTWLTWRKIIVDTYGWMWRHWWGAFSWKDPTKVDRSWAYMARHIAKTLVYNDWCNDCEIQLWYAIGVEQPVSIGVKWTRKNWHTEEEAEKFIQEKYDLSPRWIIKYLNLQRPIYQRTAENGHFSDSVFPREMVVINKS